MTLALQMKKNADLTKERDELLEKVKQMTEELSKLKSKQEQEG